MIKSSWSLQDAKNALSAVVEAAQKFPQTVTKHGKPAAIVMSVAEYERLHKLSKLNAPSFVDMLLAMPQGGIDFERIEVKPRDVDF